VVKHCQADTGNAPSAPARPPRCAAARLPRPRRALLASVSVPCARLPKDPPRAFPTPLPEAPGVPCRRTLLYAAACSYRGRCVYLETSSTVQWSQAGTPVALKGAATIPPTLSPRPRSGTPPCAPPGPSRRSPAPTHRPAELRRLPLANPTTQARRLVSFSPEPPLVGNRQPRRPPPLAAGVPALRQPLAHN
jgi:hypothetical protein